MDFLRHAHSSRALRILSFFTRSWPNRRLVRVVTVVAAFHAATPAKTRAEIVKKVHDDAVAALAHQPVKQKFEELAVSVATSTPAELAAYLKSEMAKWGAVIKDANIKAE